MGRVFCRRSIGSDPYRATSLGARSRAAAPAKRPPGPGPLGPSPGEECQYWVALALSVLILIIMFILYQIEKTRTVMHNRESVTAAE